MKKEAIKEIEKYDKDEIIAAIKKLPFIAEEILSKLEANKEREIFERASKARQKEIECIQEFAKWQSEVIKKYGDGSVVRLNDLPPEEIKKGAALERALEQSKRECKKANTAEDRLFRKYKEAEQ